MFGPSISNLPLQVAVQITAAQARPRLFLDMRAPFDQKLKKCKWKVGSGRDGQWQRTPESPIYFDEDPFAGLGILLEFDHRDASIRERSQKRQRGLAQNRIYRHTAPVVAPPATQGLVQAKMLELQ
jgi:hypothetical protein